MSSNCYYCGNHPDEIADSRRRRDELEAELANARSQLVSVETERDSLRSLIGRPYVGAWLDEILIEAAHQRDRWGNDHDHGKKPEDWFWLIGYLAGKALASHKSGDMQKAHHHTVSTAAVLAHWAAAIDGNEGIFRPGLGIEKVCALTDDKPKTECWSPCVSDSGPQSQPPGTRRA